MRTLRRLLGYAKQYWYVTLAAVLCALSVTACGLLLPQLVKRMIDQGIGAKRSDLLLYYAASLVGLAVLKGLLSGAQMYLTEFSALRVVYNIRNRLFDHIQRLSFSYHDEAETGQLISRSTSDVDALRSFLGHGIMQLISNLLLFAGVLPICLYMNWRLALIILTTMPFLVAVVFRYGATMRPLYTAFQNQFGDMTAAIQQSFLGIRVVKAFAREDYEANKVGGEVRKLMTCWMNTARTSALYGPIMDFIPIVGATSIMLYGGILVINKQLTLGGLLAFDTYMWMLIWPIRIMGGVVDIVQNAIACANRIFEVLDTRPEGQMAEGTVELSECKGAVEFRNVSFAYNDGGRILSGINLKVEPGEMVALVGKTGSGKSSLINLLPRFYDITDGELLIDGIDVRQYRLASLRSGIGIVAQETFLFGDTAAGNIAYARPGAPIEEIVEAAKSANISDFIESLPDGYETHIGERGVNLSGGQKQRIAIARALLMNPPILILDDSTSSVDTETEQLIQKALVSLTASRTTFVIAQRLSTIKRAHKIVVLDRGRIVDIGTHNELLAKEGLYSEICKLQFMTGD